MKQIVLILLIFSSIGFSQTTVRERKAVQVMSSQNIYLNGGNFATFAGGKSRTWVNVSLPVNTVEWYYSFSTTEEKSTAASINLLSQLTRLIDPSGETAIVTSLIMTPTGTAYCDVQLMDRPNADAFLRKVDNFGGTYSYYPDGSRDNYKQGTVQIKGRNCGNFCLGFKNPAMSQGISITFEVVAIVEETKIIEKTELQQKAAMYGSLGWKAYQKGDIDQCYNLSMKAIELDPSLGWVNNNIGLVQLAKNNYADAIESYSKAITNYKKSDNPRWYFNEAIKDLNNLIASRCRIEGSREILELLNDEIRKL